MTSLEFVLKRTEKLIELMNEPTTEWDAEIICQSRILIPLLMEMLVVSVNSLERFVNYPCANNTCGICVVDNSCSFCSARESIEKLNHLADEDRP